MTELLQFLIAGLKNGAIYALVGLGFTIVYAATGAINFAQGQFFMLGGMLGVAFVGAGLPLPLAAVAAVLATALIGVAARARRRAADRRRRPAAHHHGDDRWLRAAEPARAARLRARPADARHVHRRTVGEGARRGDRAPDHLDLVPHGAGGRRPRAAVPQDDVRPRHAGHISAARRRPPGRHQRSRDGDGLVRAGCRARRGRGPGRSAAHADLVPGRRRRRCEGVCRGHPRRAGRPGRGRRRRAGAGRLSRA